MRSRYSAFAAVDAGYLLRTWRPRTQPNSLDLNRDGHLVVPADPRGRGDTVEFIARYRGPGGRGFLRERSRFAQQAGRWFYLDGTTS